jgi:sugar O-acyltransferase (sialic acid O-acetyltransferase NeuD family)
LRKKIVLIGGGGHCKSVLDSLLKEKKYDEIVITDHDITVGSEIFGCKVVGNDDILPQLLKEGFSDAFITVGSIKSTALRRKLYKIAIDAGFNIVNIIDSAAVVSDHCRLGYGIFIGKNAVINADAQIGDCAIINTGAIIEHECTLGDFTHISVGANLCGNVCVGEDSLVGAGATVIQGVHIGSNVIIGAGSTVINDVEDNSVKYGLVK